MNKTYRFFIYTALTLFFCVSLIYAMWKSTYDNSDVELAIPVVIAYNEAQNSRSSAVHIGDGYFLTAYHILGKEQKSVVLETNLNQKLLADVLWSSKDYDITLMYSEYYDLADISQYFIDCTPLNISDELRFIGNPSDATFITVWGRVSSYKISIDEMWKKVVPVNAAIVPGMSGGAAVDINNRLRGINVGTLMGVSGITPFGIQSSFTGISYIVEAQDICFLMGNNIQK